MTINPRPRAKRMTSTSAAMPSSPRASKNASCGLIAATNSAHASIISQQNRARLTPAGTPGAPGRSSCGSIPSTKELRFSRCARTRRSAKSISGSIAARLEGIHDGGAQVRLLSGSIHVAELSGLRGRRARLHGLQLHARAGRRRDEGRGITNKANTGKCVCTKTAASTTRSWAITGARNISTLIVEQISI